MTVELVRQYYGETLRASSDLKTDACKTDAAPPAYLRTALAQVHDEVMARYYGCGLIAPLDLKGLRVLDLGCGAGRDVYVLAQLVGEGGHVTGIDTTPAQLQVARTHEEWHRVRFGYAKANTAFIEGDLETLDTLDLKPGSFDLIVSNCVVNLLQDKPRLFKAARALLKPGGEFYFSDVYADRRLPAYWREDPVLVGECLAGALYWNDFLNTAKAAGFADPRLMTSRPLAVEDSAIAERVAPSRFWSATYRLWAIEGLEPACEDYGQAVRYRGGIAGADAVFDLDGHHRIEAGRIFPVCGNTYRMLNESRFARHFAFFGDWSRHLGIFQGCGVNVPFADSVATSAASSGACC